MNTNSTNGKPPPVFGSVGLGESVRLPIPIIARVFAISILTIAYCVSGCSCGKQSTVTPSPTANYTTLVTTFTIGTIALQSGDTRVLAGDTLPVNRKYLTEFTRLAPDEPAGWANLGLLELRSNNLPVAATEMNKAASMAPNNAGIEGMLSLLADKQGDLAGAITHGQAAVRLAPGSLYSIYALAIDYSRQNTPTGDADYEKQIQDILDKEPTNMAAEIEMAAIAAKLGDKAALDKSVTLLGMHSGSFDTRSKEYFSTLKTAAAGPDKRATELDARLLLNVLKTNGEYQSSRLGLAADSATLPGYPILQFIKLPPMPSTPDPADMSTKFTPTELSGSGKWVGVVWLDNSGKQIVVTADEQNVHLPDGVSLPFPGAGKAPALHGVLALDVNYDLKSDLLLAGAGGIRLYIQDTKGKFNDATAAMKLPASVTSAAYTGAWAMDIDADGDLDVVLGSPKGEPTVLRNNGDGTFLAIHPFKGVDGVRDFVAADIDGDGNPDVCIVDSARKLHVLMNLRGGLFKEQPAPSVGRLAAISAADLRGEGRLSLLAMEVTGAVTSLKYKSSGTDWERTAVSGTMPSSKEIDGESSLLVADLDNNGAPDVVASAPGWTRVFMTGADHSSAPLTTEIPGTVSALAKPASGGRYDLIGISTAGKPQRHINSGDKSYNWQELRPVPHDSELAKYHSGRRVNSFGIGGEIEARAGLLYEKLAMDAPSIHFGIGSYTHLDAARILWPDGTIRGEFADTLKPDQSIVLTHLLGVSCPFLFTWNGHEMQFVTDCIWRSPLGLKINAQDTAGVSMTEDWVKIKGDQLVPDAHGQYDLRITAELWETHFFDHLSLLAVDHPIGTDIFVDERFAVPPPPLKTYLTTPLQPVWRATDDNGTDVTETIRARDGVYLDTFGRGDYQGVTRDHWVEIELRNAPPGSGKQWLVCNGFIYPTNSSINVALGQGHGEQPRGLSIETPDAQGNWSVAKAGLGFPEGKVKTILLDLSGVFKPGAPRKLRLRTNLEIYWDSIQTAYSVPDNVIRTNHLYASSAELRFRGFSSIKAANESSPDLPESYDKLAATRPKWRDLEGYYTRYGDVKELLAKVDDRYVIMNAGDELCLKFDAPAAPALGFTRDYVMIGDGWVKDGDYNTTFSKTVLPLPEHGTSSYSTRPGNLEYDPVYRKHAKDWDVYHTRYVAPDSIGSRLVPGR